MSSSDAQVPTPGRARSLRGYHRDEGVQQVQAGRWSACEGRHGTFGFSSSYETLRPCCGSIPSNSSGSIPSVSECPNHAGFRETRPQDRRSLAEPHPACQDVVHDGDDPWCRLRQGSGKQLAHVQGATARAWHSRYAPCGQPRVRLRAPCRSHRRNDQVLAGAGPWGFAKHGRRFQDPFS